MFHNLKPIEGGTIAFGGMGTQKIIGIGKIGIPFLGSIEKDQYIVKTEDDMSFFTACDVSSIGACRPSIFFINGFLCFLEDKWQRNGEGRERGDATSRKR